MKNADWKKTLKKHIKKSRVCYACAVLGVVLSCFFRQFFSRKYIRYACVVFCAFGLILPVIASVKSSYMEEKPARMQLVVQQKVNETETGYDEAVSCTVTLENTGDIPLSKVTMEVEEEGFMLSFNKETEADGMVDLPIGESISAVVSMQTGKSAGVYYATVVADAEELEQPIEQTIRFSVKEKEPSVTEEPTEAPTEEPTEKPTEKPTKEPQKAEETPAGSVTSAAVSSQEEAKATSVPAETAQANKSAVMTAAPETSSTDKKVSKEKNTEDEKAETEKKEAKTKETEGKENESKEDKTKGQTDISSEIDKCGVICVEVPTSSRMYINPYETDENHQISSADIPIVNDSSFPLKVTLESASLSIAGNTGILRQKSCFLNIDIVRNEDTVIAIRNLQEGNNYIGTSFLLDSMNTAYMKFSGGIEKGSESLWHDGDLSANVVFSFQEG